MAEDENIEQTEGEGGEGEAAKGGSKKLLIIILLAVVLIGGAGAGAFFFIGGDKGEEGEEAAAEETADGAGVPQETQFYELPELLVNLSSSGAAQRYLKMTVTLEVGSAEDLVALEKVMPRVVDDFQVYLRQLRPEDLRGSAGVYRLKEALLLRANQAAHPVKVHSVLLKEFLVQ